MRDACPPFTGHQRDQQARQIVPGGNAMVGSLVGQRGGLRGTTPIAARGIISGPVHRFTTQLDVRPRKRVF